jgi:hypothetical protein
MRRRRNLLSDILLFARNVVILDLVVMAVTAVVWAIWGERTLLGYADSLMIGAGVAIVIGIIGMLGGGETSLRAGGDISRNVTYQQAATVTDTGFAQLQDRFKDIAQSYGLLMTMVTVGLTTAAISLLLIAISSGGLPPEFSPWAIQ